MRVLAETVDPAAVRDEDLLVEACGPEDREEQARLFNACFKKKVSAEQLAWRYDRSPHGMSLSFLARPPGAEGISGYACSPRLALCGGDEATAAPVGQTGDVMTHPRWRKRGIFSGLDRAAMAAAREAGWPGVFGLPNRRSAHIFLTLGWSQVGRIRPYLFLLEGGAAARRNRLREGRLASWMAPLAARASRAALLALERRHGRATSVGHLDRFPPEVREVAREVERAHTLMVRRDAEYLNWRFLATPSARQRVLGAFGAGGRFEGYAVVQPPREAHGVGHLVDLLAPEEGVRAALLCAAMHELRAAGASAVEATAIDGSSWAEVLTSAGFHPPRAENHLIVIWHPHASGHPLGKAGLDASRWYLTDGDRDDETVG